jgi:hypothetical protein
VPVFFAIMPSFEVVGKVELLGITLS